MVAGPSKRVCEPSPWAKSSPEEESVKLNVEDDAERIMALLKIEAQVNKYLETESKMGGLPRLE